LEDSVWTYNLITTLFWMLGFGVLFGVSTVLAYLCDFTHANVQEPPLIPAYLLAALCLILEFVLLRRLLMLIFCPEQVSSL